MAVLAPGRPARDNGGVAHIIPDQPRTAGATQLTEEECVRNGGHCYVRSNVVLTSNPPQYPEKCRHCGKKRIAMRQEPYTYRDVP